MREAPSIDIIAGARQAPARRSRPTTRWRWTWPAACFDGVDFCANAYEAAAGADAVLLLTEWNEFKQLDMERVRAGMRQPVLIDGRNIYEPAEMRAAGFTYAGVGRR